MAPLHHSALRSSLQNANEMAMALDAHVGWLATMTEPAGDYVEYHGEENTTLYIRQFRDRLKTLNRALVEAGFAAHEEPDFSVVGPDTKCLNSVRLGFYSSARDWFLDSLIAHLVVHRQVPATMDDLRPTTYEVLRRTFAACTPKKAPSAQNQSCFAHPYFVGYGFSSIYVPQTISVPLELDQNENEVKYIGSSAALEKACSLLLAACGYFGPWDDPVMDIKEGKVPEFEGLEPLEETPEWLVNTVTLIERLQRIAQRSLKTRSIITFS